MNLRAQEEHLEKVEHGQQGTEVLGKTAYDATLVITYLILNEGLCYFFF